MVEGAPAMLAPMLGFSITDDFLPALGDTWAAFDAPAHGGVLLTGTVLVIEARRAGDVRDMLTRVLNIAASGLATARAEDDDVPALHIKEAKYGTHTVQYALFAGAPVPVAPAWAFVGDRWVIGLWPQTVAAALQQLDPATRGPSLLEHEDVQAVRSKLPADITGLGYVDGRGLAHFAYPIGLGYQTAMFSVAARGAAEVDLGMLPTFADALRGTRGAVSISATQPDGFLYMSRGQGTPMFALLGGAAVAAGALLPALAEARMEAGRVQSMANLRQIAMACHLHAVENRGQFPARLEDLVEKYLQTADPLTMPGDPPGMVSYAYIGGQRDADDPQNMLLYERVRGAEALHAAFLDGHVERLTFEEFKTRLAATYKRLKRESEIPAELR
jgi:prepilin-type processing-associated H-X9-DG protein